jgi:hypothetical protein
MMVAGAMETVEISQTMVMVAVVMMEISRMMVVVAAATETVEISQTMVKTATLMVAVVVAITMAITMAITTATLRTMLDPEEGNKILIVPVCRWSRIFLQNVWEGTMVPLRRLHQGGVTIPSVCK